MSIMDKDQLDKFKAAARELECDDDATRFDAMVEKIVKSPATPESEKSEKKVRAKARR